MLDLFIDKQPMFCEEIINSIKNNKISHAYLIENNNYLETDEIIISFIKEIFKASIEDEAEFKNVCNLIDNDSFEDFGAFSLIHLLFRISDIVGLLSLLTNIRLIKSLASSETFEKAGKSKL